MKLYEEFYNISDLTDHPDFTRTIGIAMVFDDDDKDGPPKAASALFSKADMDIYEATGERGQIYDMDFDAWNAPPFEEHQIGSKVFAEAGIEPTEENKRRYRIIYRLFGEAHDKSLHYIYLSFLEDKCNTKTGHTFHMEKGNEN